tara:strand:+ start:2110 stop:3780 length:1671 start_codon:yes stop_codon:yes gene_type:complete
MKIIKKKGLILEDYEDEFSYKQSKSGLSISFNRIAFIFFVFLIISIIFSSKAIYLGSLELESKKINLDKTDYRASIVDRSGNILAKTIMMTNVGINPNLVINKKNLILNLKLIFPNKNFDEVIKKLNGDKFFYLQKKITQDKLDKIILLGDKSLIYEEKISRIYPHKNLFSHVIGQIDDNNNGISGIEKKYDYELRKKSQPLQLSMDIYLQHLIREELIKAKNFFNYLGSASILMDINTGEVLSMISLPDFDLNKRESIKDVNYINRATKGVYELGSVFKTFTFAAGINENIIEPETQFLDLKKQLTCGKFLIREYDEEIPSNLTAEEILIRSGNIGSVRIGQKIGIEKFSEFLKKIGVLKKIEFDIEEVGEPIPFRWGKCKLATAAFGHGITTTPLQLAKGYSIISNGGFDINPTLIKKQNFNKMNKTQILNKGVSDKVNAALRKIVTNKEGTAGFANVPGYEVAGKTGTAQKSSLGGYSKARVNTFAAIFPISNPKFVLIVILDEPKLSKNYIYKYRNKPGSFVGTPFNTAGWTSVEIAGKIIENIGPILATKY